MTIWIDGCTGTEVKRALTSYKVASAWMAAKACHDINNDFTLFTAGPVLFDMYTDKDSNLISEVVLNCLFLSFLYF